MSHRALRLPAIPAASIAGLIACAIACSEREPLRVSSDGDGDDRGRDPGGGRIAECDAPLTTPPLAPRLHHGHSGPRTSLPRVRSAPLPTYPRGSAGVLARVAAGAPDDARRTRLRVLLLGATGEDPSYLAARSALDRIGVPYHAVVAGEAPLDVAALGDGVRCGYQGVIVAVDDLPIEHAQGAWGSALSSAEWQALADFEAACDVREVVWYASPSDDLGLAATTSFDGERPIAARLTAAGAARFGYLRPDAGLPYEGVWGYPARIVDPAHTEALVVDGQGGVLAAIHRRPDGREVLAMTADAGPYSVHGLLLEYGVLDWLTRGLFVGERRVYLSPQIDDLFLASEMYVPGVGDDSGVAFRIGGDDLREVARWQRGLAARLPAGSTFVTDLAFNGKGSMPGAFGHDPGLVEAADQLRDEFTWLNHTWDHADLDPISADGARAEIERNCARALELGVRGFRCDAAVTPMISGLDNPQAIAGLQAAGVAYVVSDTSIDEDDNPGNPGDNPAPNVGRPNPIDGRIYQVPRHPTNVYFNTSTIAEQWSRYDRENPGAGSYRGMLAAEAEVGLYYLLSYDVDPLMFHQANLRTWRGADGAIHSLYVDWIEAVLAGYLARVDLPIRSLSLTAIGRAMAARDRRNRCGAHATLVSGPDGRALELDSQAACGLAITGVRAPELGAVDEYGGQPTTTFGLSGCQVLTVPLPAP